MGVSHPHMLPLRGPPAAKEHVMAKKILQPKAWAKPGSPYSPGTQVGNLVCVAGQVSQDEELLVEITAIAAR